MGEGDGRREWEEGKGEKGEREKEPMGVHDQTCRRTPVDARGPSSKFFYGRHRARLSCSPTYADTHS